MPTTRGRKRITKPTTSSSPVAPPLKSDVQAALGSWRTFRIKTQHSNNCKIQTRLYRHNYCVHVAHTSKKSHHLLGENVLRTQSNHHPAAVAMYPVRASAGPGRTAPAPANRDDARTCRLERAPACSGCTPRVVRYCLLRRLLPPIPTFPRPCLKSLASFSSASHRSNIPTAPTRDEEQAMCSGVAPDESRASTLAPPSNKARIVLLDPKA